MPSFVRLAHLALLLVCVIRPAAASLPSPGCGRPPPDSPLAAVEVDGRSRDLILAVPPDYAPDRPLPLVVAFHGRTNSNAQVRDYFGLEDPGALEAIVAYPAGLRDASGRFTWAEPGDRPGALRDYRLFDRLLETVGHIYCIDREAVFVTGHSLGAYFANSLACARADRIRGVATVAGGILERRCAGPVAALLAHNPADRAVPVTEGRRALAVLSSASGAAEAAPVPQTVGGLSCQRQGTTAVPVLWCPYRQSVTTHGRYYPHLWPDEAAEAIAEFFAGLIAPADAMAEGRTAQ